MAENNKLYEWIILPPDKIIIHCLDDRMKRFRLNDLNAIFLQDLQINVR